MLGPVLRFPPRRQNHPLRLHSYAIVNGLCDRAIWLDHGDLLLDGRIGDVTDAYDGRMQSNR